MDHYRALIHSILVKLQQDFRNTFFTFQDPCFKNKDIMEALLYLHMTGEVLHFACVPGLKDYVFVSPTWLIDVIKCVINPTFESTLLTAPHPDSRLVECALYTAQCTYTDFRLVECTVYTAHTLILGWLSAPSKSTLPIH